MFLVTPNFLFMNEGIQKTQKEKTPSNFTPITLTEEEVSVVDRLHPLLLDELTTEPLTEVIKRLGLHLVSTLGKGLAPQVLDYQSLPAAKQQLIRRVVRKVTMASWLMGHPTLLFIGARRQDVFDLEELAARAKSELEKESVPAQLRDAALDAIRIDLEEAQR